MGAGEVVLGSVVDLLPGPNGTKRVAPAWLLVGPGSVGDPHVPGFSV